MIEIPIGSTQGIVAHAVVDDEDEYLLTFRWCKNRGGYARRGITIQGKKVHIYMHRIILGLEYGDIRQGDHINRIPLDNRRENLRIVYHDDQSQNVSSHMGSTSSYRGVYWDKSREKWCALVRLNKKNHTLGRFNNELEAAQVASDFRKEHMMFANEPPGLLRARARRPSLFRD